MNKNVIVLLIFSLTLSGQPRSKKIEDADLKKLQTYISAFQAAKSQVDQADLARYRAIDAFNKSAQDLEAVKQEIQSRCGGTIQQDQNNNLVCIADQPKPEPKSK